MIFFVKLIALKWVEKVNILQLFMCNYYLCYKSELSASVNEEQVIDILQKSQKNNLKKNITGMLLYINNHFIQIIEGQQDEVNDLYKKILQDSRHYGAKVLSEGKVEGRFFPNWVMGFRALNEHDLQEIAMLNGIPGLSIQSLLDAAKPHIALELMKHFYTNGELNFYNFWIGK